MTFLRSIFGPGKAEVWTRLAREVEGQFDAGGWFRADAVRLDVGPWHVTLDTFVRRHGNTSTTYTRLRAPFDNVSGFRFEVYPESVFSPLGRMFGMQDVEVGLPEFDRGWVVKGNDERRLRELFRTESVREFLEASKPVRFSVRRERGLFRDVHPEGVDVLTLTRIGVCKDLAKLKVFFALFAETLDTLAAQGHARRSTPNA